MSKRKPDISPEEAEFRQLEAAFASYFEGVRRKWMQENNRIPLGAGLYELDPEEQRRVARVIADWKEYITPLTEKWWRKHGYEVVWPEDDSDPCQYRKLQAA